MFTKFLDADFKQLIEDKLKTSISKGDVAQYREILVQRGADLSYTLQARGMDTPQGSVEDIIDAAINALVAEVDGIATSIVTGNSGKSIQGFKRSKAIKVTKGTAMRSRSGRFIGALKLATLLNSMVKIKAAEIMKNNSHGNTLNFRTGRLANSVNVSAFNLKTSSIHFNYMYYPYQTFEPGYKQYKPGRDPRNIFANAIAESLSLLLSKQDLINSRFGVFSQNTKQGSIIGGSFSER